MPNLVDGQCLFLQKVALSIMCPFFKEKADVVGAVKEVVV